MNVSNHRLTNFQPSNFHHGHHKGVGRIDQPALVSPEADEVNSLLGTNSFSLSAMLAFPFTSKLQQTPELKVIGCPDAFSTDLKATKVNCDVSSVVSFGSDSNTSLQKAEVSSPICSNTIDTHDKLLHRACQLFPNSPEIIHTALLDDREAIRRREKLTLTSNPSAPKRTLKKRSRPSEPYTLPINIALRHKASLEVLKILVDAGTDTLELNDGYEESTSMNIALQTNPSDVRVVDLLQSSNVKCAMISDRRKNYPLHIACFKGSSLDVVNRLYSAYPSALFKKNFNGETPLDIAQRTLLCPEDVLNFLQSKAFQKCTEDHL